MADHLPLLNGPPTGSRFPGCLFRRVRRRNNRNIGPPLQSLPVLDPASDFGEQGMVLSHGDIAAGMNFCAALPHEDISGQHDFPAVPFDAETLTVGVTSVSR